MIGAVFKKAALGVAVLVGAAVLWVVVGVWLAFDYGTRAALFGPDLVASTTLRDGTRLTAEWVDTSPLWLPEYARTLKIQAGGETLALRLRDDTGGASRTSVYLAGENALAILGPAHNDQFVGLRPLRRLHGPAQTDSSRWIYLGAFDLGTVRVDGEPRTALRFLTLDQSAECVPTLLSDGEPGAHREAAYASSC